MNVKPQPRPLLRNSYKVKMLIIGDSERITDRVTDVNLSFDILSDTQWDVEYHVGDMHAKVRDFLVYGRRQFPKLTHNGDTSETP